jgi:hypothetical protein
MIVDGRWVNLPSIVGAHDIVAALGEITNAVAIGELTPDELQHRPPSSNCRISDRSISGIIYFTQAPILSAWFRFIKKSIDHRNLSAIDMSISEP